MTPFFRLALPVLALCLLAATHTRAQRRTAPPGTVAVNNFFIDRQEISNIDYREYLFWLQMVFGKDAEQYRQAMPDTTVWRINISYNEPLVEHYFQHPAFDNYPVVGVSYEQAVLYCSWRTDRVYEKRLIDAGIIPAKRQPNKSDFFTTERYLAGQYGGLTPNKTIEVPRYRLPSKDEWELAASASLDATLFPYGYNLNDKRVAKELSKGHSLFNTRRAVVLQNMQTGFYTSPASSGLPNGYALHHMIGNVAEMIDQKGQCKGGSYVHQLEDSKITQSVNYDRPASWLGFRCVCVPELP